MSAETAPSGQIPERRLPDPDLVIDFGEPASGFAEPMPPERRAWYAERIANAAMATNSMKTAEILSTLYVGSDQTRE